MEGLNKGNISKVIKGDELVRTRGSESSLDQLRFKRVMWQPCCKFRYDGNFEGKVISMDERGCQMVINRVKVSCC